MKLYFSPGTCSLSPHIVLREAELEFETEKVDLKMHATSSGAALDLKAKLDAGSDFAELARSHSDCPSARKGGDLGSFGRGQMVPAFEKSAFEMTVGQVSDVVETDFGYHIIQRTG